MWTGIPPPPPFWGTHKLQKEGGNVAHVLTNAPYFSSYLAPPLPPPPRLTFCIRT